VHEAGVIGLIDFNLCESCRDEVGLQCRIEWIDLTRADASAEFPVQFFDRTALAEQALQALGLARSGSRTMLKFAEHNGQCI
jgi:hypothetical protein